MTRNDTPGTWRRPGSLAYDAPSANSYVKNRTLANLSSWPDAKVDALTRVLKGQPPPAAPLDEAFEITRSLPHGHVAAVLGTARQLGLDELIDPMPSRHRDLVVAMAVAQVIAPDSKLAIARGLRDETAASSLGEVLHLGSCDEDDLYAAMDYLHDRQEQIQDTLAARHLGGGTLVLYDVSSAASGGRTCPLGAIGHPKDGVHGRLQIVYGLLTSRDGIPVAIEVFKGNTGDPTTVAAQVTKVKDRFGIEKVVLVGDRGMLTAARLREDVRPAGLDWITALRAPQVKALVRDGDLQLSLSDVQDLAEITSPEFPGERLVACMNPFGEAERARKREITAGRHRGRPGQDRRGLHTGPRPAARQGQDRRPGGPGPAPPQGRQALHHRDHRRQHRLCPRPGLHRRRGQARRHLRAAHQRRARRPGQRRRGLLLQGPGPGRAGLPGLQYRPGHPAHPAPHRGPGPGARVPEDAVVLPQLAPAGPARAAAVHRRRQARRPGHPAQPGRPPPAPRAPWPRPPPSTPRPPSRCTASPACSPTWPRSA